MQEIDVCLNVMGKRDGKRATWGKWVRETMRWCQGQNLQHADQSWRFQRPGWGPKSEISQTTGINLKKEKETQSKLQFDKISTPTLPKIFKPSARLFSVGLGTVESLNTKSQTSLSTDSTSNFDVRHIADNP